MGINVDFADVRSVMANAGSALMGIGTGSGKSRAQDAAMAAISSPLLDFTIEKAKGVVFSITGGSDMTLNEINTAADVIYQAVDPDANIIFGALLDDGMMGEMSITVIATGVTQIVDGQPLTMKQTQSFRAANQLPTTPSAESAGAPPPATS